MSARPMEHPDAYPPGTLLAGKYRVLCRLGSGGVGLVVEAEHLKLGQRVAVKVLIPHVRADAQVVARFEREARAMAALKSPHVAGVFDVDRLEDGTPYLVMELLEGRDLGEELRDRKILPTMEALDIVRQAAAGLEVVHAAGIVHRDIKPANLFLVPAADGVQVKVMDFGISKFEGNEVTTTGSTLGTPAYMSPEQVRSPRDVDARSDLWSLGVILFRALAARLPFEGDGITAMSVAIATEAPKSLSSLRPDLDADVVALVARMLDKNRDTRIQSARTLFDEVTAVMSSTHPASHSMVARQLEVDPPAPATTASSSSDFRPLHYVVDESPSHSIHFAATRVVTPSPPPRRRRWWWAGATLAFLLPAAAFLVVRAAAPKSAGPTVASSNVGAPAEPITSVGVGVGAASSMVVVPSAPAAASLDVRSPTKPHTAAPRIEPTQSGARKRAPSRRREVPDLL